jgi:Asp-tRNA(Asn)/Glu-tRNA(Gln) amidotransferase A subunit family amidase
MSDPLPDLRVTRREAAQLLGAAAATQLLAAEGAGDLFPHRNRNGGTDPPQETERARDLDAHLKQIARVNPKVNAIVTLVAEQAIENARKADEAQARGAARAIARAAHRA